MQLAISFADSFHTDISQADAGSTFEQTIAEIDGNWKSVARATGLRERECASLERLFSKTTMVARVSRDAATQADPPPTGTTNLRS